MGKPKISVLIPVYNRSDYLAESIESVLSSSWEDFEVIIIDDGSTDDSYAIAEMFAKQDKRILLFQNENNTGQFQNRNRCVEHANGEYIKYLDSDDIIYPHGLEVMLHSILKFPEAGAAVSFDFSNDTKPYPFLISPEDAYTGHFFGKSPLTLGPSGIIFRRKAFLELGGYSKTPFVGSDTEFMLKLAARFPVVKMPTSLVWWRRHEGQDFTEGHSSDEYLFKNFRMQLDALEDPACPLSEELKGKAIEKLKQNHARLIFRYALKSGNPGKAYKLYREFGLSLSELLSGLKPYQK